LFIWSPKLFPVNNYEPVSAAIYVPVSLIRFGIVFVATPVQNVGLVKVVAAAGAQYGEDTIAGAANGTKAGTASHQLNGCLIP